MSEYRLYVFDLLDTVRARRGVPPRRGPEPYVYVGYTSRNPDIRIREHRDGRWSGDRRWSPHFDRDRPDLYVDLPVFPTLDSALAAERMLADELTRRGFTVVAETGKPITIDTTTKTTR